MYGTPNYPHSLYREFFCSLCCSWAVNTSDRKRKSGFTAAVVRSPSAKPFRSFFPFFSGVVPPESGAVVQASRAVHGRSVAPRGTAHGEWEGRHAAPRRSTSESGAITRWSGTGRPAAWRGAAWPVPAGRPAGPKTQIGLMPDQRARGGRRGTAGRGGARQGCVAMGLALPATLCRSDCLPGPGAVGRGMLV